MLAPLLCGLEGVKGPEIAGSKFKVQSPKSKVQSKK